MSSAYFYISEQPLSPENSTATTNCSAVDDGNRNDSEEGREEIEGGDDLPVAAKAGIGVGVGIFGVVVIACGILWFLYLRKQRKVLAELQRQASYQPPTSYQPHASFHPQSPPPPPPDASGTWKVQHSPMEMAIPEQHTLRPELSGDPRPIHPGFG